MNIKNFKDGDIITRNEPMMYGNSTKGDSSWCRDRRDEGWEYYPENLWQKISKKIK